jgi:hypothetical protein
MAAAQLGCIEEESARLALAAPAHAHHHPRPPAVTGKGLVLERRPRVDRPVAREATLGLGLGGDGERAELIEGEDLAVDVEPRIDERTEVCAPPGRPTNTGTATGGLGSGPGNRGVEGDGAGGERSMG